MALGEIVGWTGLTGLYRLNGDATDSSGNGNNLVATNVVWNTDDTKTGSGSASFPTTVAASISFGTSFRPSTFTIIGTGKATVSNWTLMGDLRDVPAGGWGADMIVNTGFGARFYQRNSGGTFYQVLSSIYPVQNTWYNMVVSIGPSGEKVYLNGDLVVSNNADANWRSIQTISNIALQMGVSAYYGGNSGGEKLDEVVTFANVQLTDQEVQKHYTYKIGRYSLL